MADCPFQDRIQSYADGELDDAARAEVERHLPACPSCAAELAALRALSQHVAQTLAKQPEISQIALHRVHARVNSVMDEGILRFARVLGAIAACLLVGATIGLAQFRTRETQEAPVAPPWVGVSASNDSVSDVASADSSTPAAAWYLADANRTEDSP
jgi:anti-sigma factor RsiW